MSIFFIQNAVENAFINRNMRQLLAVESDYPFKSGQIFSFNLYDVRDFTNTRYENSSVN